MDWIAYCYPACHWNSLLRCIPSCLCFRSLCFGFALKSSRGVHWLMGSFANSHPGCYLRNCQSSPISVSCSDNWSTLCRQNSSWQPPGAKTTVSATCRHRGLHALPCYPQTSVIRASGWNVVIGHCLDCLSCRFDCYWTVELAGCLRSRSCSDNRRLASSGCCTYSSPTGHSEDSAERACACSCPRSVAVCYSSSGYAASEKLQTFASRSRRDSSRCWSCLWPSCWYLSQPYCLSSIQDHDLCHAWLASLSSKAACSYSCYFAISVRSGWRVRAARRYQDSTLIASYRNAC